MNKSIIFISMLVLMFATSCVSPLETRHTNIVGIGKIPGQWTPVILHFPGFESHQIYTRKKDTIMVISSEGDSYVDLDPREDFMRGWATSHRNKFFESIFLDKKLYSLYRDSAQFKSISLEPIKSENIIPCKNCNSFAVIQFRKKEYQVPHLLPQSLFGLLKTHDPIYMDDFYLITLYWQPKNVVSKDGFQIHVPNLNKKYQIWFCSSKSTSWKTKFVRKIKWN